MKKTKYIISLIVIAVAVIQAVIWYLTTTDIDNYKNRVAEAQLLKQEENLKKVKTITLNILENHKKNISYLNKMIVNHIQNKDMVHKFEDELLLFSCIHSEYFQTRIIDLQGYEKIRINNRDDQKCKLVEDDSLQYKGNRYYFKDALKLKKGDIYFSRLDLNVEHDTIATPYTPTYRIISPIYINGEYTAILCLNYNAKAWLKELNEYNVTLLNTNFEIFSGDSINIYAKIHDSTYSKIKEDENYLFNDINVNDSVLWTILTTYDVDASYAIIKKFRNKSLFSASVISFMALFVPIMVVLFIWRNEKYIQHVNQVNAKLENNVKKLTQTSNMLKDVNNKQSKLLAEKDVLVKEVHHRVKNNLQVILSILSLETHKTESKAISALLDNISARIHSMAIVHKLLHQTGLVAEINIKNYMEELMSRLDELLNCSNEKYIIEKDIPEYTLNLDTAIPLGLIATEIFTNICKYAFPDKKGHVYIKIKKINEDSYHLFIGDDGIGYDENEKAKQSNSIGLMLIQSLVEQLDGSIIKDNSKQGTHYNIKFKNQHR